MIVIGADIHKRNHTLVAVRTGSGEVVGELEIRAEEAGHRRALRWAREIEAERVWALEDCRHVSRRLEEALLGAGERVVRVAPRFTGLGRREERRAGKSDSIDALAVARAVVREGPERFPAAFLDEPAMEIRLLADHRENQIAERTRAQNRLRWHLLDLERQLPGGSMDRMVHLRAIASCLEGIETTRARVARELLRRITEITREVKRLDAELAERVRAHRPALLEEVGCGPLSAATLIGHTRRRRALRERLSDRSHGRGRPDPRLLGQAPTPSPAPQRRSPAKPRPARDRDHPRTSRPRDPGLPRQEASGGQE